MFAVAEKNTEQSQTLISGPLLMLGRLQNIRMNHAQAAFQTIFNHHGVEQIIVLDSIPDCQKLAIATEHLRLLHPTAKPLFYKEGKTA